MSIWAWFSAWFPSTWPTWGWRLVAFAAFMQIVFMVLEMFLWSRWAAPNVANLHGDFADKTVDLGRNMGLYNGLLGAGLILALNEPPNFGIPLALFLLVFMLIAGIFGGFSVKWTIAALQGGPAFAALFALYARM
jgi:putative membrane protein